MNKTLIKDALREIKSNFGRFFAILALLLISMFAFNGLFRTVYLLREVPEDFYKKTNMHDATVVSTLGLTSKDETIIGSNVDVDSYEMEYDLDVFLEGSEETIRLQSKPKLISVPMAMDGRLPEKMDEIALDYDYFKDKVKIGDKVKFFDDNIEDNLENTEYKVVGLVRSPDHLSENITEMSTNGSGYIDSFGYIEKDNFKLDYYTKAKIRGENSYMHNQDPNYPIYADYLVKSLENSFEGRSEERLAEVKTEGEEKIFDSETEIKDAREDIEDARIKLEDAKSEIDDGKIKVTDGEKEVKDAEKTLADSKKKIDDGWAEYRSGLRDLEKNEKDARIEISDAQKKLSDSKIELDNNRADIEKGLNEIEKNRPEIENARISLENAERDLNNRQKELDASKKELESKKQELENAKNLLSNNPEETLKNLNLQKADLESRINAVNENLNNIEDNPERENSLRQELNKLNSSLNEVNQNISKIMSASTGQTSASDLEKSSNEIRAAETKISEGQAAINNGREELAKNRADFNEKYREFSENEAKLKDAKIKLDDGQKKYNEGIEELNKNKEILEKELRDGRKKLEDARLDLVKAEEKYKTGVADLRVAKRKLSDARADLIEGEKDYKEGLDEFNKETKEAKEKIADGEIEIADAREYLLSLEEPNLMIESRYADTSYQTISDFPRGLNVLAYIFSFLCLLVALLLSLTTITRMVDERRTIIGTYKGLGYNNGQIASKFLLFGGISGILGAFLGILLGQKVLSSVIFDVYMGNFILDGHSNYFSVSLLAIGLVLAIITTLLSSYLAVRSLLNEKTANLLRPKPPAEGSRIFLERTHMWNKMNFFQKVTARNIFRYKGRMFMTIFGVAICMSIMILGFGMRYAIQDMSYSQFNDVQKYDYMIFIDEEKVDSTDKFLENDSSVEIIAPVNNRRIKLKSSDNMTQNVSLVIETGDNLDKLIGFRDKDSKSSLKLSDNGILITKKLADLTNKNVGDSLEIIVQGKTVEAKITGIIENYIDHYIYASDKYIMSLTDKEIKTNSYIIKVNEDSFNIDEFEKALKNNDDILGYVGIYDLKDQADRLINTINVIVVIIIFISMLLSFVVLYNLTNINISERKRELSTMKVLGFYPKEVTRYVFKETFILTALGIVVGLILGNQILNFVLTQFAPSKMLFGSANKPLIFTISSILVVIFSVIVMFVMHKKLKSIDPLEALKAVE